MTTDTTQSETPRRGLLGTGWLRFALAVTFLTRLPLPVRGEVTPADLRASLGWYPFIGLVMGALGWGVYWAGKLVFPPAVVAALVIILLEMCTGALHLDGLMDTCDGMGSNASRERALAIMKDSRVGAMGVFGAVAVLLLKVTALASLEPAQALIALGGGWAAARALPSWNVLLFRYARVEGTGKAFTEGASIWPLLAATLIAAIAGVGLGWLDGICLVAAAILLPLLVQAVIARKLGGLTGDVYGFGIELAETLALLGACVLSRYSLNG